MKLEFGGFSIDLLFGRLNANRLPEQMDVTDDAILTGMDEKSILSLNGARVADKMLKLVPNTETFKTMLRAIKLWANRM